MSKYKVGDKFIVEIAEDIAMCPTVYRMKHVVGVFTTTELDKLQRYKPHPFEMDEPMNIEYIPYRSWQELIKEPADMTRDEKERLARIKAIPSVAFEAARAREKELREQIMELEKERDKLCDFLNGEV